MRKLYYEDCHLSQFQAQVISCTPQKNGWDIILNQTAFYPEGGGQGADTGSLGHVRVLHTREEDETVIHLCSGPLEPGQTVEGTLDWDERFDRMQQHTGEHIVSGVIHRKYGWHNTGFHMGAECITIDFDGVVPAEDLPELEQLVNRAVWENLPVQIDVPSPEELPGVVYRTKRALPWPVRIVRVPGYDSCACCGVHVARTGEIGLIKLLSSVNFRSGSRIEMLCGRQALAFLNRSYEQNLLVSRAFSAKLTETGAAAERINHLLNAQKAKIARLETEQFASIAQSCSGKGNVLVIREGLEPVLVRKLADLIAQTCGGIAAVFSGSDDSGYSYCLVSREQDLRQFGKEMNAALNGRGGGKPQFLQGSVKTGHKSVLEHFSSFLVILQ